MYMSSGAQPRDVMSSNGKIEFNKDYPSWPILLISSVIQGKCHIIQLDLSTSLKNGDKILRDSRNMFVFDKTKANLFGICGHCYIFQYG